MDTDLAERLRNGAKLLGVFWSSGQRCSAGWGVRCGCATPTRHCVGKRQWRILAEQAGRTVDPEAPAGILEAMTIHEAEETGVLATVSMPEPKVQVGPGGQLSWRDLAVLSCDPEGAKDVLSVLCAFPGARVVPAEKEAS